MRKGAFIRTVALGATLLLAASACGSDGDNDSEKDTSPLKLGYILPETGDLAFLGPPQQEAMNMAIEEINDAGGVLDNDIDDPVGGDEANDASKASDATDRVLGKDVDAIIGAASTDMSLAIIDKITGSGVLQCSGSNTAPTFTDYDDDGYYFRTAPSDELQGPVLADTVIDDGFSDVAVVARADDYGEGLADATAKSLEDGGANVVLNETYDDKATDFSSTVSKIDSEDPDAVVVVAFEEGAQIIKGLIEKGLEPPETGIYGADGLRAEKLGKSVDKSDPGVIEGMKGTAPESGGSKDFLKQLKDFAPDLDETQFAPQVYDCVNVVALAAEAAESTDPSDIKEEMNGVTKDGEECSSFEECKKLLDDDEEIDYNGASGPLDFVEEGEPGSASIEVYGYDEDGELNTLDTKQSEPAD